MPTMGVDVAVVDGDQILLTLRADIPVWCVPGGRVEDGESIAQTAIREVREETGLEIELIRLVGIYSRPQWSDGGDHVVLFLAKPVGGTLEVQETEVVEACFFHPDALPETLLWWQRQYIADALSGVGGGVARTIDVMWPLNGVPRSRIQDLNKKGKLPQEAIKALHVPAPDTTVVLEVGEGG